MKWWPLSPCSCWPTISDHRKSAFPWPKTYKKSLCTKPCREIFLLFLGGLLMPQILFDFTYAAHNKLTLVPVTARKKALRILGVRCIGWAIQR